MKLIKCLALTLALTFSVSQKSHAIAGVVMAVGGVPAAGAVALSGLGVAGGGLVIAATGAGCYEWDCVGIAVAGLFVGALLLDEETSTITFSEFSIEDANKNELTQNEINIYNSELEEVNAVFEEVTLNLDADSTTEEAKLLWSDYKEFLSPETFKVMQTLVSK